MGATGVTEEQQVVRNDMLVKVSDLFKSSMEKAVTVRVRKYKTSNDSLRKDLAATKKKLEGMELEFQPQVDRTAAAEKMVKHLEGRLGELKLTIEALQKQNSELNGKLIAATARRMKS